MKFKQILLFLILSLIFLPFLVNAEGTKINDVNIYFFYSGTCPHCTKEKDFLNDVKENYHNVFVYYYEISDENGKSIAENIDKFHYFINTLNIERTAVPFTIIGDQTFMGFNSGIGNEIEELIQKYTYEPYQDVAYEYLDVSINIYEAIELKPSPKKDAVLENDLEDDILIPIPLIGNVSSKDLSLPLIAIIIGTVDGFNPCAMWILLFLIGMLIGTKNHKKMLILGTIFLITSALVYFLFMIAWLNLATFLNSIYLIRMLIALIAIIAGVINLYSYFNSKDGCTVVEESKRKKTFDWIKRIISEKKFVLAIIGIIILAIFVNIIELACSAGLPLLFTQILSLNNLSPGVYLIYISLYIFFFLIDDLIVFIIAVVTLKTAGLSTKYGKISHLIGGIIMLIIGTLLILKPEWLMFNF